MTNPVQNQFCPTPQLSQYINWLKKAKILMQVILKKKHMTQQFPTWYSSSSLESNTACSTLRCLSIMPSDNTIDLSWVITYSSPAQEQQHACKI